MAPSNVLIAAQLRQMIYYHLDNNLEDNALFLAGRLHALDSRNLDSLHLLSVCHMRLGQHKTVYQLTKIHALRGSHLGCSHIFAQACLALDKFAEGVLALDRTKHVWSARTMLGSAKPDSRRFLPDAAAAWCLQGKLCRKNMEEKRAIDCFVDALRLNPFMWDAFEALCHSNVLLKPNNIFRGNAELLAFLSNNDSLKPATEDKQLGKAPGQALMQAPVPTLDLFSTKSEDSGTGLGRNNITSKMNIGASSANVATTASWDTPPSSQTSGLIVGASTAATGPHAPGLEPPAAPVRKTRSVHLSNGESAAHESGPVPGLSLGGPSRPRPKAPSEASDDSDPRKPVVPASYLHQKRSISGTTQTHYSHNPDYNHMGQAPQRRSTRLSKRDDTAIPQPAINAASRDPRELKKARATGTRGRTANASTVGRVVSGNRKAMDPSELSLKPPSRSTSANSESGALASRPTDAASERDSMNHLLDLFSKLGMGYYALSKYQCQQALTHWSSLPSAQRDTPWVLVQTGKAYYEQTSYAEAERAFARVRKLDPTRVQDMEVYSTILWHLKLDTELAHLSHELTDLERTAPQAWVTVGNSFALSRDHDQALKCFKRATQLDSNFSYAWTLQGHEHFENEEYDKAARAFRQAIGIDRRQYNSWYGLGKCYDKQGRTEQAEEHFKIALQINPHNAVITVGIGMVLEKQRKHQQAMGYYDRAIEVAPQSVFAHFRKARMLTQMRHLDAALESLLLLKDLAPDDPNVHFMLGCVYKRLHDKPSALKHFTTAMNLDPKAAGVVKEAMEELDDDDDDEVMDEDDAAY